MSNENDNENISQEDEVVCAIEFYYDGETGTAKYRFKNLSTPDMDPIALYGMAVQSMIETHDKEILDKMNEFMIKSPISSKLH